MLSRPVFRPRTTAEQSLHRCSSQFKNNCFTEMCSGSEAGSYLRLIDFVYHSTLGLRVIKKKKKACTHARLFEGYSGHVLAAVCSLLKPFVA